MTVLHDAALAGIPDLIDRMLPAQAIQPSSVDLSLGERLDVMERGGIIDPECPDAIRWRRGCMVGGRWLIEQGALCLGTTAETLTIPDDHVGLLHGRSTLGRLGLLIHVTAGLLDPGYHGRPTLEIVSLAGAFRLRPGMQIAQLTLHRLTGAAERPYAGRYQGDTVPTPARVAVPV